MEASSVVYRTVPRFPATRVGLGGRVSRELNLGVVDSRVSVTSRNSCRRLSCQFSDLGHGQYYVSPRAGRSASAEKKDKEKSSEIKTVKKKLKFIEKLSKDLSMLPQMAAGGEIRIGLVGEVKEASDVLLAQLQQLRSEQKELKRKLKAERAMLKATLEKSKLSSSSSSSESSDSECGEVVDMKNLRTSAFKPSKNIENALKLPEEDIEAPTAVSEETSLVNSVTEQENKLQGPEDMEARTSIEEATLANSLMELEHSDSSPQIRVGVPCSGFGSGCSSSNGLKDDQSKSLVEGERASTKKIEICMGGKCKKLGAAALLEEFERKVGAEATVVTCKCMGKCKTAPNVRVRNSASGAESRINEDSVRLWINPTFTGVVLQDVDLIVVNLLANDTIDDEFLLLSP